MDINLVQVFTNVAVAGVTAWVAGSFGVRQGLKRAQRERAFERRLEWYENAFRLVNRFRSTSFKCLHALAVSSEERSKLTEVLEEFKNSMQTVDDFFDEGLMFAEKSIVTGFRPAHSQILDLFFAAENAKHDLSNKERLDLVRKIETLWAAMDEIIVKIGTSVRKHLDLDAITAKDLKPRPTQEHSLKVGSVSSKSPD